MTNLCGSVTNTCGYVTTHLPTPSRIAICHRETPHPAPHPAQIIEAMHLERRQSQVASRSDPPSPTSAERASWRGGDSPRSSHATAQSPQHAASAGRAGHGSPVARTPVSRGRGLNSSMSFMASPPLRVFAGNKGDGAGGRAVDGGSGSAAAGGTPTANTPHLQQLLALMQQLTPVPSAGRAEAGFGAGADVSTVPSRSSSIAGDTGDTQ